MIDFLGHCAYVVLFTGQLLLAYRVRLGWVLRATAALMWTGIGLMLGLTSIWIWGLVFVPLELRGWWRWGEVACDDQ